MYKLVMGIRIDSLIGIQNKYPFSGIFKYILSSNIRYAEMVLQCSIHILS